MKTLLFLLVILPTVITAQFKITPPSRSRTPKHRIAPTPDTPLMRLGNPATRDGAIAWYQNQGQNAVPSLLTTLRDPDRTKRLLSLSALQYAWSDQAVNPVLGKLLSTDKSERNMAWNLLNRHLTPEELNKRIEPGLHRMDPKLVASILPLLEAKTPSLARTQRLMQQPRHVETILMWLPRYSHPDLIPMTRRLAMQTQGSLRSMAIASLIHQQDTDPNAKRAMAAWLSDPDPRVREMSAEYFRWHGDTTAEQVLQQRLQRETDPFVRATLKETLQVIRHRATRETKVEAPVRPEVETYYHHGTDYPKELDEIKKRADAFRRYAGYPRKRANPSQTLKSGDVIPPTRSFRLEEKSNYGTEVPARRIGPFVDSIHVGIDVSWKEEMATVVAIAHGQVRHAQIGELRWGGIVVVEHTPEDAPPFCSLYARLGPLITVQEGDHVSQGDKLGSLGRNYTWANGGYRAHLHFGIHKGPFGKGDWITEHLDTNLYRKGKHGWHSPWDWIPERRR